MTRLLNIGIHSNLKDYQVSLVRAGNFSALLMSILAMCFSFFLLVNSRSNVGFGLAFFIPAIFTFVLNAIGNTSLSRIVFVLVSSLLFAVVHAYFVGKNQPLISWMMLAQFIPFLLLLILFDTREKVESLLTFVLLLLIFIGFPFLNYSLNVPAQTQWLYSETSHHVFFVIVISLGVGTVLYGQWQRLLSEKACKAALVQLQEKDEELKKQEKELQATFDEITKTHKEDDKRNWISKGINQLNNILRESDNVRIFEKVLTHIVRYVGANQGSIYEISPEDEFGQRYFMMRALYGLDWGRIKQKTIPVGDESLLSTAYNESAPVYRIDVPETYGIESALGNTRPGSLFVVPMMHEGSIEGVLEVMAIKKLEEYEKEYVKKVAEILARFIESHQVNVQSKELLEKTNQQTEEMRAQEEEMRQNMEELQATQEELHRKEREYIARIKELEEELNR